MIFNDIYQITHKTAQTGTMFLLPDTYALFLVKCLMVVFLRHKGK